MGVITLDLPVVGQPNTTEDVKVRNNFQTLQNTINGNIDASNLSPIVLSQLGNFKQALAAIQVQDVGNNGQIRAGRVLTPADFTNMGLSTPLGLWNLGTVNDASGNVRNLTNKGTVTFDTGITGSAAEAAVFTGSTGQALYIADTGAADPFRIRTGSWGCWFRTMKRGTAQYIISKFPAAGGAPSSYALLINASNVPQGTGWNDNAATAVNVTGVTDVADGRWHFAVITHDATKMRLYVDGVLDAQATGAFTLNSAASGPLNIGGFGADAVTATVLPFFDRVDEAFVLTDVLSPEQVYNLYCVSIPHTLGVIPTGTRLAVRRARRGGTLSVTNFPATPVRLHNFTAASLNDEGSNATPLVANPGTGAIVSVAGADGSPGNAYSFSGAHTGLSATDTGLPSGLSARSYGIWFKTTSVAATGTMIGWGTIGTADARLLIAITTGNIFSQSGADAIQGPNVSDGLWHFAVTVEDNAAVDLVKRKFYLDGRLVGGSTVLTSLTLAGANRFRIGAAPDATQPFVGQTDGGLVYAGALTPEQVKLLYNIGSQQLAPAPKDDADNIEALELTRVLAHFDNIEGTELIDLAVIA
jgi:hypothetical protein